MPTRTEIADEFRKAATTYKDAGGEYDEAVEILDDVFEILDEVVSDAATVLQAWRQVKSGKSSTDPSAETIEKAKAKLAEAEAKAGKPLSTEAKKARKEGEKVVARAVADAMSLTCPGYGPWGSIAVGKLPSIAAELTRHGAIAKVLMRQIPIGTSSALSVREVVSETAFELAKQQAAAILNVEMGIEDREDREHAATH